MRRGPDAGVGLKVLVAPSEVDECGGFKSFTSGRDPRIAPAGIMIRTCFVGMTRVYSANA